MGTTAGSAGGIAVGSVGGMNEVSGGDEGGARSAAEATTLLELLTRTLKD